MTEQRTGQKIITLGTMGAVQVTSPMVAAAAANWWDPNSEGLCVWAAYQPKGAANLAASYTDLSGNGNNCGPGVAPAWDAVNGWKFDGATQYLTTTFIPQNDQTQSILVQFTNYTSGAGTVLFGCCTAAITDLYVIAPTAAGATVVRYWNGQAGGQINAAPILLSGNLGIAGNAAYRNGAAEVGAIAGYNNPVVVPLYIGAYNRTAFGAQAFGASYIQALAIYDCTLTAPQMLAVATAMAAL